MLLTAVLDHIDLTLRSYPFRFRSPTLKDIGDSYYSGINEPKDNHQKTVIGFDGESGLVYDNLEKAKYAITLTDGTDMNDSLVQSFIANPVEATLNPLLNMYKADIVRLDSLWLPIIVPKVIL